MLAAVYFLTGRDFVLVCFFLCDCTSQSALGGKPEDVTVLSVFLYFSVASVDRKRCMRRAYSNRNTAERVGNVELAVERRHRNLEFENLLIPQILRTKLMPGVFKFFFFFKNKLDLLFVFHLAQEKCLGSCFFSSYGKYYFPSPHPPSF